MASDDRVVALLACRDNICRFKRLPQPMRLALAEYQQEFGKLDGRPDREDSKIVAIKDAIYTIVKIYLSGKNRVAIKELLKQQNNIYIDAKRSAGLL